MRFRTVCMTIARAGNWRTTAPVRAVTPSRTGTSSCTIASPCCFRHLSSRLRFTLLASCAVAFLTPIAVARDIRPRFDSVVCTPGGVAAIALERTALSEWPARIPVKIGALQSQATLVLIAPRPDDGLRSWTRAPARTQARGRSPRRAVGLLHQANARVVLERRLPASDVLDRPCGALRCAPSAAAHRACACVRARVCMRA